MPMCCPAAAQATPMCTYICHGASMVLEGCHLTCTKPAHLGFGTCSKATSPGSHFEASGVSSAAQPSMV